jgi:gamma-glutamylaminecyclotransferase
MNVHVMVYGTLLRGEPNHGRMAGARFVRDVRTEARFTLADLGPFPALREGGSTAVLGEVYEVTPQHLAALDRFEGVPHLYERVTVRLADSALAQAYVQRGASLSEGDVIASGDWRAHRKEKSHACETA